MYNFKKIHEEKTYSILMISLILNFMMLITMIAQGISIVNNNRNSLSRVTACFVGPDQSQNLVFYLSNYHSNREIFICKFDLNAKIKDMEGNTASSNELIPGMILQFSYETILESSPATYKAISNIEIIGNSSEMILNQGRQIALNFGHRVI